MLQWNAFWMKWLRPPIQSGLGLECPVTCTVGDADDNDDETSINQYFILCLFTSRCYQTRTQQQQKQHTIIIYTNFPTGL